MEFALLNAHIFSPADGSETISDILISNGFIKDIKKSLKVRKSIDTIDLNGKTVVPGLFDMHVHFREPGQTHKEDLVTGSAAAANGGFTGVLCMPNTSPTIDNPALLKFLSDKGSDNIIDIRYAACATKGRNGEELAPILSLSEAGALALTDDGSPIANPLIFRKVLELGAQCGLPVIQHCEDMNLSDKGVMNEGLVSTITGLRGIPSISETSVVARDLEINSYVENSHYHIQHISCKGSVVLLREAKRKGLRVTGEACPHHFLLTDTSCIDYDTNFKMNPPLRTSDDVQEILRGIQDDTIDVICTDHAPHTEFEKSQGFVSAPFGIIGLETAFGLAYTYLVKTEIIDFRTLIVKMSVNPRKILNMESIQIEPGSLANLTVLELNAKWTVKKKKFKSRSANTPFDGFKLHGKPFMIVNKDKYQFCDL